MAVTYYPEAIYAGSKRHKYPAIAEV